MESRNSPRKRRSPKIKYFYLGDKLYKVLLINRPQDLVYTYCFTDKARGAFVWTDIKRRMEPAFPTDQVAKMINRSCSRVRGAIKDGNIPRPQRSYPIEREEEDRLRERMRWSRKDVLNLYDFFSTVGKGRPRDDGVVIPWKLPTKAELIAMMNDDVVLYVKTSDGEFAPVWKEHNW